MPLHLEFHRDGQARPMSHGIGSWHLMRALDAAAIEQARKTKQRLPDFDASDLNSDEGRAEFDRISKLGWAGLSNGHLEITHPVSFKDPSDGEILDLLPGDVIRCWR